MNLGLFSHRARFTLWIRPESSLEEFYEAKVDWVNVGETKWSLDISAPNIHVS